MTSRVAHLKRRFPAEIGHLEIAVLQFISKSYLKLLSLSQRAIFDLEAGLRWRDCGDRRIKMAGLWR